MARSRTGATTAEAATVTAASGGGGGGGAGAAAVPAVTAVAAVPAEATAVRTYDVVGVAVHVFMGTQSCALQALHLNFSLNQASTA